MIGFRLFFAVRKTCKVQRLGSAGKINARCFRLIKGQNDHSSIALFKVNMVMLELSPTLQGSFLYANTV